MMSGRRLPNGVCTNVVLTTRDQTVSVIALQPPEQLNAINSAVLDRLDSELAEIADDDHVRAAVLHGLGRAFSAGADLGEVGGIVSDKRAFDTYLNRWHSALDRIVARPKPVVTAAHGVALAGGFELVQV